MSKRKIIEIYIEEKEDSDDVNITFNRIDESKNANEVMKMLICYFGGGQWVNL